MTTLRSTTFLLLALFLWVGACAPKTSQGGEEEAAEGSAATPELPTFTITDDMGVSFENMEDGDIVNSPFTIEMGVTGMTVEPAGAYNENTGHHHLVINGKAVSMYEVVPADDMNIHYGDGRTETEVTLEPGDYTLTLQFADGYHRSYGEQLSTTISVTVL